MKIILRLSKNSERDSNELIEVFRVPIGKAARRATTGTTSNEIAELSIPTNVLVKFRKSCAAYCTAGFVIGLGKLIESYDSIVDFFIQVIVIRRISC